MKPIKRYCEINKKRWQVAPYHLLKRYFHIFCFFGLELNRFSTILYPKKKIPTKLTTSDNVGEFGVTHNLFLSLNSQHISLQFIKNTSLLFCLINIFYICNNKNDVEIFLKRREVSYVY